MPEKPIPESYSETFIGECIVGSCGRPATVRVHEDFVMCALHYHVHHLGENIDEMNLALELMKGWRSEAKHHHNDYLVRLFDSAMSECQEKFDTFEEMMADVQQAERESIPNERIRVEMGRKEAMAQGS